MTNPPPFLLLVVIDGFGCRDATEWNAIAQAEKPNFRRLFREDPWVRLEASGLAVGLPEGQMGNSEVGHLNIGAGRVVDQDVVRISKALRGTEMGENESIRAAVKQCRNGGGRMHLIGLLSDGGVHSRQIHLHALIDVMIGAGVESPVGAPALFVHGILDGRDTPPRSAAGFVRLLVEFLESRPRAQLSTLIGRYYTMDRDQRWERTRRGYDLMTLGIGTETGTPVRCIERFYEDGVTDEFMEPIAVLHPDGAHEGKIRDGDVLVFFNFRADRMRQIVTSFRDPDFSGFDRAVTPSVHLLTMTSYHRDWDIPVIFEPQRVTNHLGEVLSRHGLRQLRIAETEKYAHVTFFFSGGSDLVLEGEERILVPSPRIATYDLKPEMSLEELADRLIEAVDERRYDVVVLNIANPDMVGHTGKMEAAVAAIEATDRAIGRIVEAVDRVEGVALITADHGNCELMFDEATGQPHTAHTTSPVPLILHDSLGRFGALREGGALGNVSPTVLEILGLPQPEEMTAESLLQAGSRERR